MSDYDQYGSFEEFDFAMKYPEKYKVLQEQGISVKDYKEHYQDFVEYATGKRFVKSGSKWIEKTIHM